MMTPTQIKHLALALAKRDGVTGHGARLHGTEIIAEKTDMSVSSIQHWIGGSRSPNASARKILEKMRKETK